jgi:undecaprenyl-diphosphatase
MPASILHGLILGIIQGATEFLPVSSTGHLILVPRLLGWEDPGLAFDAIIHLGTLAALLWATRTFLGTLIRDAVFRRSRPARILALQIVVACIPALALGALFGNVIEDRLRGAGAVAFSLAFWGIILWIADRYSARLRMRTARVEDVGWARSIMIGSAQAIALIPGVSRSGITMTAGLAKGLDRQTAVEFSFLLSIPTIAAAGASGLLSAAKHGLGAATPTMLIFGFLASIVSGAIAIRFLKTYVASHRFTPFVLYRLALAAAVIILV